jgi:tetratricopeptide (TPR) repeat protein
VLPFRGDTTANLFESILQKAPVAPVRLNPDMPAELERIINKSLEKDRDLRYQHASDIRTDLQRLKRDSSSTSTVRAPAAAFVTPGSAAPVRGARWRPLALWAGVAGLAVVIAVTALLWTRPARALTEKDTILLTDFRNTTGDAVFDDTLKQALAVDLEQSPFLNVLSEQRAQRTLRLMGKTADTRVTQDIGREICEREGIKAMLVGAIANLGSQYVITLDALNSRTADSLARSQAQAASKEQVLKALGSAASEIRGKLGESLATVQKFDKPLEEVTTPSLDALKAYALGQNKRTRGDELGGIALLKRAIELDPNFALAYAAVAIGYGNLWDLATAEEYTRKAYERVDRVSGRERYFVMIRYDEYVTGDMGKAIETYQLLIQNYPRDWAALQGLGVTYALLGQYEKELEYMKRSIEADPQHVYTWGRLIEAYTALGGFDEARETARQAIAHGFDAPVIHSRLGWLAVAQNDAAAYNQESGWLSHHPSQGSVGVVQASFIQHAAVLGQLRQSEEEARKAVEQAKSSGLPSAAARTLATAAVCQAMAGRSDRARRLAGMAIQTSSDRNTSADAALAYAYSRDIGQSRFLLDRLMKGYPENTRVQQVYRPQIEAFEAIERHDAPGALAALEGARSYDFAWDFTLPYVRGLAYLAAGQGPQAAAEFQKIIDHPGVAPLSPVHSLAHLGLARAYSLAGDKTKARIAYQDFLALWKDADSDVPILKQANAEYARLQ